MIDPTSWVVIAPEVALLTMACVITLGDLWVCSPQRSLTYWLTQACLLILDVVAGHACHSVVAA